MRLEKTEDGGYTFHIFEEGESINRRDLVGSGWIARLTGLHPKYRYERQFVEHPRGEDDWYDLHEGGIYEYRELYTGGSRYAYQKPDRNGRMGDSGFFTIANGSIVHLKESEVRDRLKGASQEAVSPDDNCKPRTE